MLKRTLGLGMAVCLLFVSLGVQAATPFVVDDIRVEGVRRISEGTVFNYLPISVGDEVDGARAGEAIRSLFDTGFFEDVELRRDGDTLVVVLEERPSIRNFSVAGNKELKDDDLDPLLRQLGLTEGRVLDRSILKEVTQELHNQYYARGKYGVKVNVSVEDVAERQVDVDIDIQEGERARIRAINIVGNEAFSEEDLLDEFELRTPNLLSFYRRDDRYAAESLIGDLESLRSYYMDRGYAAFALNATQVSLSPDKKDVYITLGVEEGGLYTITDIEVAGDTIIPKDRLARLVVVQPGSIFNRGLLTQSADNMTTALGAFGYSFARADPIPEFDHENNEVSITFLVDQGQRVYVRNINFLGTEKTNDEVFRREMRQLESGWVNNTGIERSKIRLQRLPFVEEVEIEDNPVPGVPDQVDLDVTVQERPPGNFNFGLGFSDSRGVILSAGVSHSNFLGRGDQVQAQVSNSNIRKQLSLSHTDPYITPDGVSRQVSLFYRDSQSLVVSGSNFDLNTAGIGVTFGYPISEYSRVSIGAAYSDSTVLASQLSSFQVQDFVAVNGDSVLEPVFDQFGNFLFTRGGAAFKAYELQLGWQRDTRNRAIFADRGMRTELTMDYTLPFSDIEYLVVRGRHRQYFPITENWALMLNSEIGIGRALGDTSDIPPFKNFFAGGPDSIRGYRESWLGPRDSRLRPYGGNTLVSTQLELIVPIPDKLKNSMRFSVFYDIGGVFYEDDRQVFFDPVTGSPIDYSFDTSELRRSYGIAAVWLAPMGAMKFSYAFPVNPFPGSSIRPADEVERFQFSISNVF